MTYQLTREEMELVRDMVRILLNAYGFPGPGMLSLDQEKELVRLAEQLDPLLR